MHKNARTTKSYSQLLLRRCIILLFIVYAVYTVSIIIMLKSTTIVTYNYSQHFYDL